MVKSLKERPLDLIYVVFFAIHIPTFFLMDSQILYPEGWRPMARLIDWYLSEYNDPIVGGAIGEWKVGGWTWSWIHTFFWLEALFQLPIFFLGIKHLKNDNKTFYPWILLYGASTATTLLPSLAIVLTAPLGEIGIRGVQLSHMQRAKLLGSYVPFLIIPLTMAVDMAYRISKMIEQQSNKINGKGD